MPLYSYAVKTPRGETIRDIKEVDSKEELVRELRAQDLTIISITDLEKGKESLFKRFLSGTSFRSIRYHQGRHSRITKVDMCFFSRHLAISLSAGIPLLKSLEIISRQSESVRLAKVANEIAEHIKNGLSLSESILKYPKVFSAIWTGLIEVGEASGNLPVVLEGLADYIERRLDFETKVKSALIYPAVVLAFAFIAMIIFFKFILPRFSEIFQSFDITLPLITQVMCNISNFIDHHFLLLIGLAIGLAVIFIKFKSTKTGQNFLDDLALFTPIINKLTLISIVERFCATAYILLNSGVPIVYSLDVISRNIGNSVVAKSIEELREKVRTGKSLSGEVEKIVFFPPLIAEVVRIGEEAGNLSEMFEKVSIHYQKELNTRISQLLSLFEPILILVLGVVIGVVVISLFLPIFQLSTLGG
ncbi:MAG: type II secretion system F family protein [Candidatus Omnitrophota bacterium]